MPVSESALKHPGVVITAASGDYGYDNWLVEPYLADRADYPAASPFVIGVGGTRLGLTTAGTRESETVWNGHGAAGSGCSFRWQAPRWQQEVADWPVGCERNRAVADVSADADPYTGAAVYDSYTRIERGGHIEPFEWETIHFIGPGACVIEATQQGDAEFQPAAARQSIRVNAAPLPILPGPPGGPLSAPFVSTPDSSFRLAKGSKLDRTTGAITFSVSVTQTGTLSWNVTFADGSFGVLAASRSKCRRNQVMLRGACRPRRLTFGTGALEVGATAAASGNVSFTVAPSGAARSALQKALRLRRPLAVRAAISFQSAFGGSPVAHSYSIDDRLSSKRHVTAG